VFQDLRHRETRLKGKCGRCRYNGICGGCRGRALALTGDYMAADPTCFIGTDREPSPGSI
jgi:radical SAM protein with 4Fe4S-binding SPASM domain